MAVAIPYTPPQFSNSLHLALTTAKDLSGPAEFNLSNTISIVYISSPWISWVVVVRTWSTWGDVYPLVTEQSEGLVFKFEAKGN